MKRLGSRAGSARWNADGVGTHQVRGITPHEGSQASRWSKNQKLHPTRVGRIHNPVNLWKRILAGALVVLWVPLTMHCRLESLPGMEFLVCCPHEDASPHQDSDCDDDVCAAIESASYKTENNRVVVPTPVLAPALLLSIPLSLEVIPAANHIAFEASPPELPATWQFFFRTALPPRAPSFVS